MKIAIVLPRKFPFDPERPNSIETVVRTHAWFLPEGDELAIFCDDNGPIENDLDVHRVKPGGGRRRRNKRIVERLKAWKPDLVEVHQHTMTAHEVARSMRHVPTTLYRHNSVGVPRNFFYKWNYRRRYSAMAMNIMVSRFLENEFVALFPDLAERCTTVTNSIAPEPWFADPGRPSKTIAYGGRAAPEKGFFELCAGLAKALDMHADWNAHLCVWEWQHHEAYAEASIEPLKKFGDRVRLETNQPLLNVAGMLKTAAIAVVPSQFEEPFGLAALEAHVAGAALISSGRGGLREVSGPHARYIEEVTVDTVTAALNDLMQDDAGRLKLAKAGQDYALKHHNAEAAAKRLNASRLETVRRFNSAD